MTITFVASDIAADEIANAYGTSASGSSAYHSVSAGRLALLFAASRPEAPTYTGPTNGTWTSITSLTGGDAAHGAGSIVADTGISRAGAWSKVLTGSETGAISIPASVTTNAQIPNLCVYSTDAGGGFAATAFVSGSDTAHGTSRSVTFGAWGTALAVGDVVVVLSATDTDNAGAITAAAFTQTGTTFGTVTRRARGVNTTGCDNGLYVYEATVTSGGSTNALTFSWSTATMTCCGPSIAIRLREAAGTTVVTKQVDISWDVAATVTKPVDISWDVAKLVTKPVDVSWDVLGLVTKPVDISWDVVGRVVKQVDVSWDVAAAVSKAVDVSWDVRSQVTKPVDILWDVAARVTKATDVSWDVAAIVSKPVDVSWDVRAGISRAVDISWDVASTVVKSSDVSYDILALATKGVDISWDVAAIVSKATDIIWDVQGLGVVAKSVDISWDVRAIVTKPVDISWDVLALVSKATDVSWDVYRGVSKAVDISWDVLGLVSRATDISWDVAARVTASTDILWDVERDREPLPVSTGLPGRFTGSATLGDSSTTTSVGAIPA